MDTLIAFIVAAALRCFFCADTLRVSSNET